MLILSFGALLLHHLPSILFSYQGNQPKGHFSFHEQERHPLRSAAFLKSTTGYKVLHVKCHT